MRVKVLCLNLWYGGRLWEPLLAFLRRENPDILCAQEVYDGRDVSLPPWFQTVERFKQDLGFPHVSFAAAYGEVTPHGVIPCGNAVFSRLPLTPVHVWFYDTPFNPRRDEEAERPDFTRTPRNLQHVAVETAAGPINVFNTQGIWGFDDRDNPRRLHQSEVILRAVRGKPRTVLAGDFNVGEDTETMRRIGSALTSIFVEEFVSSFNLRHKTAPGFATSVVDGVFVSSDLRVVSRRAPHADVSDHIPLVCELAVDE